MKFENLLETGIIKDNMKVVIKFRIAGRQFSDAGVWFSDNILNHLNDDIIEFKLDYGKNKIVIKTY